MTEIEQCLAEIRARWQASTLSQTPWESVVTTVRRGSMISEDVETFKVVAADGAVVCGGRARLRDDDCTAIAHAPADIAWLLDRIAELQPSAPPAATEPMHRPRPGEYVFDDRENIWPVIGNIDDAPVRWDGAEEWDVVVSGEPMSVARRNGMWVMRP
jgi:hypothetical protein